MCCASLPRLDEGSFGLLPHRLDCVAALVPGILTYETKEDGTVYLAVDQGVLVKAVRMCAFPFATPSAERISASSMTQSNASF